MLSATEKENIQRFLDGMASEEEVKWIEDFFGKSPSSPELKDLLLDDWNSILPQPEIKLDHLLDKIHHIIRLREPEKPISVKTRFFGIYSRVAAVLLIPVLLSGLWFLLRTENKPGLVTEQSVVSTLFAPLGSRVAFNLPDGTTGYLNSGSKLSYSTPFSGNRCVQLQGEAWFEVVTDELHPFQIDIGLSTVKVLGTRFNVSGYRDEGIIEVVLAEGSVEFTAKQTTPPVLLKPSERLVFNGEDIHIEKTDPMKYRGWTEGKLIFRGDNMASVARRLERWYNIEVEIASAELEEYVFRATFEDDSLREVLRLLSMTSPIRYSITPRKAMPDGSWMKEKVIFYKL